MAVVVGARQGVETVLGEVGGCGAGSGYISWVIVRARGQVGMVSFLTRIARLFGM